MKLKNFNIIVSIAFLGFYQACFRGDLGQGIVIFEIAFASIFAYFLLKGGSSNLRLAFSFYLVSLPIINFAKGSFFTYNIHIIILIILGLKLYTVSPKYFKVRLKTKSYLSLFIFSLIYYLLSFISASSYVSNLKIFELILMAGLLPYLWFDHKIFSNSIVILLINGILFVFLATTFGDRLILNKADIGDSLDVGGNNPIGFGLPLAFCLLLLITKRNYFVTLPNRFFYYLLIIVGVISLFLTTSRASILVLVVGMVLYLLLNRKFLILIRIIIASVFLFFLLFGLSQVNKNFQFASKFLITRSQAKKDDLNSLSSGRLEQWQAFWDYFQDDKLQFVLGFGPGEQFNAHEIISKNLKDKSRAKFVGVRMAYHALPLLLIVEIGFFGFIIFYTLIIKNLIKNFQFWRYSKNIWPLLGVVSFLLIGLSVSSFDTFSGLFLGLSFCVVYKSSNIKSNRAYDTI